MTETRGGLKLRLVAGTQRKNLKSTPSARALLASNLVSLRAERQWSQEELAFRAGLHRTFVTHVERQSRNIALDNLEKLAVALGVAAHELLVPVE